MIQLMLAVLAFALASLVYMAPPASTAPTPVSVEDTETIKLWSECGGYSKTGIELYNVISNKDIIARYCGIIKGAE